jgi:hypothetical protein
LPIVYYGPFKLQSEDGCKKAETCSCCVLLINCILCKKVVFYTVTLNISFNHWEQNGDASTEKQMPNVTEKQIPNNLKTNAKCNWKTNAKCNWKTYDK